MSQNAGIPLSPQADPAVTTCSNCHSPMPSGLRFCRNCGFRLGEGLAEYTETVRFKNGHPGVGVGNRPTADAQAAVTSYGLSGAGITARGCGQLKRRRRKMSGITWIFLGLLVFFLTAGVFTALFTPARRSFSGAGFATVPATPRSYIGVDGFDTIDGAVTFGNVEPPGSPADKAGLVGGDIITSYDGQNVEDEDQLGDLVKNTPIGKTVDVVYVRDGVTKKTTLTTISKEEFDRLSSDFAKRPEGRGLFGYEKDECKRVQVPDSKIYGVKLGTIRQNLPADLAGIKKGDIVIEFDKIPIRTRDELVSRVYRALPYSTVNVKVIRGSEQLDIPVKMGKQ